jgi:hypothetical protein
LFVFKINQSTRTDLPYLNYKSLRSLRSLRDFYILCDAVALRLGERDFLVLKATDSRIPRIAVVLVCV